ncbi:MAG: hypothetical protein K6E50_02600 [Lachnospiraceae bacterium]|nr:hypothetical protein [Lachnospiraceae bacterium]
MEFSPSEQKMYCVYCGSKHTVEELNAMLGRTGLYEGVGNIGTPTFSAEPPTQESIYAEAQARQQMQAERAHATIQMKILHCNACGAELAVNGVESSSFCIYCGQATVVMDRVEDYLQPDYLIPFRITREQAEAMIRSRLSQGSYIPEEIKNFKVDKLRGIYIPFWLYDMYYGDDQCWKYTVKRGKSSVTRYAERRADCQFKRMTLDASKNLNDDSSQRLEPYNMNELQAFDPAYLSGFYSDRFDMGTADLDGLAFRRAKELFDDNVKSTVRHSDPKLVNCSPEHHIMKREYALLPVWFLTFRYEGMPYTIMVNGQTGKMVGAVPFVKKKAYFTFAALAALFCVIFVLAGAFLTPLVMKHADDGRVIGAYFGAIGLGIWGTWTGAIKRYKAMMVSIGLTSSKTTSRFVRERAGD